MASKKIFLEIGPGRTPVQVDGSFSFQNFDYIGLENNPFEFYDVKLTLEVLAGFSPTDRTPCELILGSATSIPLENDSVSIVYASNVFGSRLHLPEYAQIFMKILSEVRRVLHPRGVFIISECNTPVKILRMMASLREFQFLITQFGAKTEKIYSKILDDLRKFFPNVPPNSRQWERQYSRFRSSYLDLAEKDAFILISRVQKEKKVIQPFVHSA